MSTPDAIARELLATMDANRIPKPGIYKGLPERVYHGEWRAVSNSALQHMKRSPAHFRYAQDHPMEPTQAMLIGSATHCAILLPDLFPGLYAELPDLDMRTKAGKEAFMAIREAMPDAGLLKSSDYAACLAMRDAVHKNTAAKALLSGYGDFELSFAWDDKDTGVRCKGRADRVSWEIAGGTIVDLKTTRDARRAAFERSIFSMGYYNQGALYVDGIRAHKHAIRHYSIIAVEKEPPYGVAVYRMKDEVLEAGRIENRDLLDLYVQCEAAQEWPGYPVEITDVGIPEWSWKQIEERIDA